MSVGRPFTYRYMYGKSCLGNNAAVAESGESLVRERCTHEPVSPDSTPTSPYRTVCRLSCVLTSLVFRSVLNLSYPIVGKQASQSRLA